MQTRSAHVALIAWAFAKLAASLGVTAESIDLTDDVVVVRPGDLPNAATAAAVVFMEEFAVRTGIRLSTTSSWPHRKTLIAITSMREVPS